MSAQPPPDWDHRRVTLGKGQWALTGDAGEAGPLQRLLVWRRETLQREQRGWDDSGVEKQEGAERKEPELREEARGSCTRQLRPSAEQPDGPQSE